MCFFSKICALPVCLFLHNRMLELVPCCGVFDWNIGKSRSFAPGGGEKTDGKGYKSDTFSCILVK